ncbi:hypothetical protein [Streptomyces coelicoflavus]
MTDNPPERPAVTPVPPPLPTAPPPPTTTGRRPGKRTLTVAAAVAVLLVGGGVTWWALGDGDDAIDHVEVSGGKLVVEDSDDEYCDDNDVYSFNDCDADTDETYEFVYKISNEGDGPANYAVVVNAFDKDGDFVGQTFVSSTHLAAGKTDADKGEFTEYSEFANKRELSDIASVKVAHVERLALAN